MPGLRAAGRRRHGPLCLHRRSRRPRRARQPHLRAEPEATAAVRRKSRDLCRCLPDPGCVESSDVGPSHISRIPHHEEKTMSNKKSTFALCLGNRGLFPASLISGARVELISRLQGLGHEVLVMEETATRYGAVETVQEAARFAAFLAENRGRYDGVILSLPNFGDENGGIAALQDAGVPIFIQAYPDDMNQYGPRSPPRFVLRQAVHDGCLLPERPQVYGAQAARRQPGQSEVRAEYRPLRPPVPRGQGRASDAGRRARRTHHGVQDGARGRGRAPAPRHHRRDARSVRRAGPRAQGLG